MGKRDLTKVLFGRPPGYAGVVKFGGLRIGGLSGIYKPRDYACGHFEHPPYNEDTKRSCYHIRNVDVFRLKQVSNTNIVQWSDNDNLTMIDHTQSQEWTGSSNHPWLSRQTGLVSSDVTGNSGGGGPLQKN